MYLDIVLLALGQNKPVKNNKTCFVKKMGLPRPLFVYFCSFQTQILEKKTVDVSGIRTWIVGVEGEQADHLTTTTAQTIQLVIQ